VQAFVWPLYVFSKAPAASGARPSVLRARACIPRALTIQSHHRRDDDGELRRALMRSNVTGSSYGTENIADALAGGYCTADGRNALATFDITDKRDIHRLHAY
jgi:hypothetical protein